jgi:hypothetical protein
MGVAFNRNWGKKSVYRLLVCKLREEITWKTQAWIGSYSECGMVGYGMD